MVKRIYVERKTGYDIEAQNLLQDIKNFLLIKNLTNVRYINRYDVQGITDEILETAKYSIFSAQLTDVVSEDIVIDGKFFAAEYLPGQYDQRADLFTECLKLLTPNPKVKTARIYMFYGNISDDDFAKIKNYIINAVESRETSLSLPETLEEKFATPSPVADVEDFINLNDNDIPDFIKSYSLAMDVADVKLTRDYFGNTEKRNPTIAELRLLDTYWSDHCRHTTFLTVIEDVKIAEPYIQETYNDYLAKRKEVYGERHKNISLMDLATLGAKYLKMTGQLKNVDESEEVNACSVKIKVDVDGKDEDWLFYFKNETHNHPTEIEPFGGAATCLGGGIRDPLSGRSCVHQAMRVTGCADPRTPFSETIPGKLPQRKITQTAANGYSSYGNQIGGAAGQVTEIYHPDYVAKRMEMGALVGAAPVYNVVRETPIPGDVVILLGGRTGRDGIGAASGSSKSHTSESLTTSGAEVQKGDPIEERKIVRLFRDPKVTRLIKRCNDFGAGGVSVCIGELADGILVHLDNVPTKYDGMDGTEIALSESQERMAVVIAASDAEKFIEYAQAENCEATVVAEVTEEKRLVMYWNGQKTVDISREFLSTNGALKYADVEVKEVNFENKNKFGSFDEIVSDLNVCSQRGLGDKFDSTVGAGTVVNLYGGKHQLTAPQYMAAKIPVLNGETKTASVMAFGFDPFLSTTSQYHGAIYAVVDSLAKIVASGASYKDCYLSFQEYFERNNNVPSRWGKPFAALLGAFKVQMELGVGSIGGKDSMSGSFENLDVPPMLCSFAVAATKADKMITPEFKKAGSNVYLLECKTDENNLPDFDNLRQLFDKVHKLASAGKLKAIYAVGYGGVAEAVVKMCFGNRIGFKFSYDKDLFISKYGSFVVETDCELDGILLGHTTEEYNFDTLEAEWKKPLESVFPTIIGTTENVERISYDKRDYKPSGLNIAKPRVLIPVFPGTNGEYDSQRAFDKAGALTDVLVFKNFNDLAKAIDNSQILMLSGGSESEFITTVLKNPIVNEAIQRFDGLILGIGVGFQALVKSGLLPGDLIFNTIGRHQSMMVNTRIASVKSPWFSNVSVGDIHTLPISTAEGRFISNNSVGKDQIAAQYVDFDGNPTMDIRYNPSGSMLAVEGIFNSDGRIFGKMAHNERISNHVAINIPGNKDQKIFEAGVKYFK